MHTCNGTGSVLERGGIKQKERERKREREREREREGEGGRGREREREICSKMKRRTDVC